MKIIALLFYAAMMVSVASGSTNDVTLDVSQAWEALRQQAVTNGIADANRDFSNGVYRIETYGLRGTSRNAKDIYLEKQYQVTTHSVAGCIVTSQILGHAEGYNTRMKELLLLKYEKDVFHEAETLWKQGKLKDAEPAPPGGRGEVPRP